jgi:hypothetical protein
MTKHWRWPLGALILCGAFVTWADGFGSLAPFAIVCIIWPARVGLIFEPRWSIDDELSEIQSWT